MSRKCKENHNHGKKNAYYPGGRNPKNDNQHPGKNPAIPRTRRENYRKTVYPSHEKRNRRSG